MTGNLIGLGGVAFAGKDSVADHLENVYGWIKTYMSKPLETALLRIDPWVSVKKPNWEPQTWPEDALGNTEWLRYSELHKTVGYDYSKKCLDARDYLQKLGTEVGRNMFDQNVWVNIGFSEVDKLTEEGFNVAMTGIRFPNELQAIKERNGLAVWIERPGFSPVNQHASDNTLHKQDFDIAIHNIGTLEELYDSVKVVLQRL